MGGELARLGTEGRVAGAATVNAGGALDIMGRHKERKNRFPSPWVAAERAKHRHHHAELDAPPHCASYCEKKERRQSIVA
jgi:hypothetical protein